jgi:pimeloyl-ACP methyl ester carboxylesterase
MLENFGVTESLLTTFETGDGRTLSYLRRGAGPLVVCVPGGPGLDPEAYFASMQLPGYELLVFAPRGTGRSSAPPTPEGYRISGYVEDVESLRTHLSLDQLTLYGNSYGGSIVLAYACARPSHVARLIVSAAAARVDPAYHKAVAQARRRFAEAFPDGAERLAMADEADAAAEADPSQDSSYRAFRTAMACSVAREGPAETAYLDRLCSAPTNDQANEEMWAEWNEGLDLLEHAGLVRAPALIIAGESDIVVPPATVRLIAEALPSSRYLELPAIGHFVAVEASEQFRSIVSEFLAAGPI